AARGPAAACDVHGEQYISLATGAVIWAFNLGGTVAPVPAAPVAADATTAGRETEEIETGTLLQVPFGGAVGNRYAMDEHTFNPLRARVKVGARVMFVNNGRIPHTIAANDGSWNSGSLGPAKSFYVTFDKPGTYLYSCTDHP